jgi:hypothetical protein
MNAAPNKWKFTRRGKWILYPLFIIAFINFAVFWVGAVCLGGDAINGYARDGHYFLSSHGSCTEVSPAVWHYSYFHTISVWATHGLTFATAAILFMTGDMRRGG